jgi:hypothetical protein
MTSVRMTEVNDIALARASLSAEVDDWRLRSPHPIG